VREVWRAPNGRAALALVVRCLYEIGGEQPVRALGVLAAKKIGKDAEEAVVSDADQLRAEGRKEGIKVGRRAVPLRQLRTRFGELPEPVAARVKAARAREVDIDRILTATALDDVLADG
jgi:hypothetical protein